MFLCLRLNKTFRRRELFQLWSRESLCVKLCDLFRHFAVRFHENSTSPPTANKNYHDASTNCLMLFFDLWKNEISTCLRLCCTALKALSPQTLMCLCSLSETVSFWIWANPAATKWKWHGGEGNHTHVPALHPVLHDMSMRAPVEGSPPPVCGAFTREWAAVLFVCEYADRALEDRLLPRRLPLRLWLARLSRTETSAGICVAARRPYWWAAPSLNKHASCRSTPPAGESRARRSNPQGIVGRSCDRTVKQTSLFLRHQQEI